MTATVRRDASRVDPIATLFPGYFALVMATGIIAIGAAAAGPSTGSPTACTSIAAVAYVVLAVLLVMRGSSAYPRAARRRPHQPRQGLRVPHHRRRHQRARQRLGAHPRLVDAWLGACGGSASPLWACFVYTTLIAVVLRHDKPGLGAGINGTWFLLTVSTESIAVLGALLLGRDPSDLLAFACIAAFALGLVLYLIVMTMVFLRWTFQPLEPTEADPPAWIAAGAVAITVLAGSNLLAARAVSPRIDRLAPFIEGLVMLAWATATFWFPLMVAIGIWRHIVAGSRCATTPRTGRSCSPSACTAPPPSGCAPRSNSTRSLGPQGHPRRRPHRLDRSVRRPARRGCSGSLPFSRRPVRSAGPVAALRRASAPSSPIRGIRRS